MMTTFNGILLFLIFILCTSCSAILGIHTIKPKTDDEILRAAEKLNIPKGDLFTLDTAFYRYIFSFDQNKYSQQTKNHYQPLQALYFEQKNSLVKFFVNCYAGGSINLNWNRNGELNSFLPK